MSTVLWILALCIFGSLMLGRSVHTVLWIQAFRILESSSRQRYVSTVLRILTSLPCIIIIAIIQHHLPICVNTEILTLCMFGSLMLGRSVHTVLWILAFRILESSSRQRYVSTVLWILTSCNLEALHHHHRHHSSSS